MNKKVWRILAIVLAVVTAASGGLFFYARRAVHPAPAAAEPTVYSYAGSAYTAAVAVLGAGGEIYQPTDLEGVYFTADLSGSIAFYDYINGAMTPTALEVKTVKTTLAATYEKIPVTVSYVERDGKKTGCGIFRNAPDSGVDLYSFAFVKLCTKPAGYGGGELLLADFDPQDLYRVNKTYSEIYNFNLTNGTAATYVSNNTRLIDLNGTFRQDWTMLTDQTLRDLGSSNYFLSSRYYAQTETGLRTDAMVLSGNYRPTIAVKDFLGLWFVSDGNGLHYLRKTDNGFANVLNAGGKEQTLTAFDGDWAADYVQNGRWLLQKESRQLTDLMTGAVTTLKDVDTAGVTGLFVSPDGQKAALTLETAVNAQGVQVQTVIYCGTDGSNPAVFCEPLLYDAAADFVWLSNSAVMHARPLREDGATVGSVVYTFPAD